MASDIGIAKGLLRTRDAYLADVEAGKTDLSHADWYQQMMGEKESMDAVDAQRAAAERKAGYDKVARK